MDAIYDDIGVSYSVTRCTDPKIAQQLFPKLQGATRIVNIGAGTVFGAIYLSLEFMSRQDAAT